VAFYDPGLGSASDGGHFKIGWTRWLYNLASMATGLGITRDIVDCYAAIISLYEEGDGIFLISFRRGAYTVRSVAGVTMRHPAKHARRLSAAPRFEEHPRSG
jgi:uncharacterized protein (DUF2235 family)